MVPTSLGWRDKPRAQKIPLPFQYSVTRAPPLPSSIFSPKQSLLRPVSLSVTPSFPQQASLLFLRPPILSSSSLSQTHLCLEHPGTFPSAPS